MTLRRPLFGSPESSRLSLTDVSVVTFAVIPGDWLPKLLVYSLVRESSALASQMFARKLEGNSLQAETLVGLNRV